MLKHVAESTWHWQSVDDSVIESCQPATGVKQLLAQYDLCVTGEVLLTMYMSVVFFTHLSCLSDVLEALALTYWYRTRMMPPCAFTGPESPV